MTDMQYFWYLVFLDDHQLAKSRKVFVRSSYKFVYTGFKTFKIQQNYFQVSRTSGSIGNTTLLYFIILNRTPGI